MILSDIQKQKFFETSGVEHVGLHIEGQFWTNRAYNDDKYKNLSPWCFSYVIDIKKKYLICELSHKMTNNRVYGWDWEGHELPRHVLKKYFKMQEV